MRFIADLHIHSKYSRATSRDLNPENLWKWAQLKGISVVGSGDFTHPQWIKELEEKLGPAGNGLFSLKKAFETDDVPDSCRADVSFMLSAEISCIYKKNDKTRKIHSVILAPGFSAAEKINARLKQIGNLHSDGRPILGLDAKELLKIVLDISPDAMVIPAHAWTPHFSVFGAVSGFDSLEECYEELTPHIHAIETGLSSDPLMNWRLSALDNITLISNSDAHSPSKLGREANVLETEISYGAITDALKTRKGFSGTIEFFPEEGKYHYDGHRACDVSFTPKESIRYNNICPVCSKKLTIGVMHRVDKLADRDEGFRPKDAPPFHSIIPLVEIIGEALSVGPSSKKVAAMYFNLLSALGNEFTILLDTPLTEIENAGSAKIAEAIAKMRSGDISIAPGYDGEFGKIRIFEQFKKKEPKGQTSLF
ncbi:MAG: DNA helicase UvrD [Nitrospirae bacterium]|nr:DNA helicase UvrD [Nitrospirota bacterium]